ncbi:ComF family protein [Microlunatus elymi]|nr:phosphoribosyltransferase family protein [Microlunatus elymi]
MHVLRRWGSVTAELFLGAACPGCEAPGPGLCPACRVRLDEPEPRQVRPTPCPAGFPTTYAGGPYDELVRRLISAHKERQAWLLTGVLGDRLARSVGALLAGRSAAETVFLVPIPSSPAAVRSRGRDSTAALTRRAVRRLGIGRDRPMIMKPLLRPTRRLADQSALDENERRQNLAGAYAVRRLGGRQPPDGAAIIVDDLVTTGSSLTEARRALTSAGVPVLGAAVIAATVRRYRPGADAQVSEADAIR